MKLTCGSCGKDFEAKRSTAQFCSAACQKRESRRKAATTPPPASQPATTRAAGFDEPDEDDESIAAATIEALREAGRERTPRGRLAIKAARIIDASYAVQGMAALMKDWDRALDAALAGAQVATDEVDEVERKRQEKLQRLGIA